MSNSKKVKNGTIIKQDLSQGNFVQTSKTILTNKDLTDSAVRLLQLIGDTPSTTKISLTYYRNLLGWSKAKLTNATKNLIENGYLKINQYPKGTGKGFSYSYTVSFHGNLHFETDKDGNTVKVNGAVKPYSKKDKPTVATEQPKVEVSEEKTAEIKATEKVKLPEQSQSVDEDKEALFFEALIAYNKLTYSPEFEFLVAKNINDNFNVKGLIADAEKFLKDFYNSEIKKLQNPEQNKRAFEATKAWLKKKVFDEFNIQPYTEFVQNIETKYTKMVMMYPPKQKVDYETEQLERTND
ncbi:hypothetical protein ABGT15_04595 [Flavobacterium enshiense]|uniref:hypothetical protein n=1 Tax=Flavobacterium enshiense TaxID=1341165 RepID=UPI00345DC2A0